MKKWVRWWGLAAFLSLSALIALFWFFFLDGFVRRLVESTGTSLVGAEVDVRGADVSLFPLGITLTGIQVTNPKNPSNNSMELSRVAFTVDGLNLLRRKVIINEMSLEGLRLDTVRKKPGRVVKASESKQQKDRKQAFFPLPSMDLPSAKTILDTEQIESLKLIESAKIDLQQSRALWEKRIRDLPDRSVLDGYRERVSRMKNISRTDIKSLASAANDLLTIKKEMERDINSVKEIRAAYQTDYSRMKTLIDRAERSPAEDLRRIKAKYPFSGSGLQNLTRALFSPSIADWIDSGRLWYARLSPLYERAVSKQGTTRVVKPLRGRGVDVLFKEAHPKPDLLVNLAKASMQPTSGSFAGEIHDITPDQDVLGRPLTFRFDGTGLPSVSSVSLRGTLDHVRPLKSSDTLHLLLRGYRANDLALSSNKDLSVMLRQGTADLDLSITYDGSVFDATIASTVTSVRLELGRDGSSGPLADAIRSAFSAVNGFVVHARISGTPDRYDIQLTSDLDGILQRAVGRVIGEKGAQLEKELKDAIYAKTEGKIRELRSGLDTLTGYGDTINSVQQQFAALLQDTDSLSRFKRSK